MRITFRCGHPPIERARDLKDAPTCPQCGERIVKSVVGATPVFTGTCKGPLVQKGTA